MRRLTLLLAALGALLLVSASPALASELNFKETFGSAAQPEFKNPAGVAVDPATGDLLVIDMEDQTLHRYKANGEADNFSLLGSNVIDGKGGADKVTSGEQEILSTEENKAYEVEVAVAPPGSAGGTAGDIYVTDALNERIVVFGSDGKYLGQKSLGFDCGVSVGPEGSVYVGDYYEGVHKLTPSAPGVFTEAGNSPFAAPEACQVAAGYGPSAGSVFVGLYGEAILKLDATTGNEDYEIIGEHTVGIDVDHVTGHLYVAHSTNASVKSVKEFDVSGGTEATLVSSTGFEHLVRGVAVNGSANRVYVTESANPKVGVYFTPATPTTLTIAKTGTGTIVSNPKGIECTGAKTGAECEHAYEVNENVTLTASPASGYAFSAWAGCTTHIGLTCTVEMSKAKTVKVTFVATPSLTITKAGSGQGKAGATGISCDENCSTASSAVKTGTVVTVKATPAKGSKPAVFEGGTGSASGCSGETCTFTISENSSVKVKFDPIPTKTLTVKLTGPAAYKGKVSGKGIVKGLTASAINCGAGCTSQTESFFATDTVTLTAAAGTGYTFAGWSLEGSEAGTCTGTTTPCTIPTSTDKTLKAEFK